LPITSTPRSSTPLGQRHRKVSDYYPGNIGCYVEILHSARTSAVSSNVGQVIRAADLGVDGEVAFRVAVAVAPAHVAGDRGFLSGVAAIVAAVEGEVADRGELALDPVQPRGVAGCVNQLDVVGRAPRDDLGLAVGSVVVTNQVKLPGREATAQLLQKSRNCGQRLRSRNR
jgi:hypothetical protein